MNNIDFNKSILIKNNSYEELLKSLDFLWISYDKILIYWWFWTLKRTLINKLFIEKWLNFWENYIWLFSWINLTVPIMKRFFKVFWVSDEWLKEKSIKIYKEYLINWFFNYSNRHIIDRSIINNEQMHSIYFDNIYYNSKNTFNLTVTIDREALKLMEIIIIDLMKEMIVVNNIKKDSIIIIDWAQEMLLMWPNHPDSNWLKTNILDNKDLNKLVICNIDDENLKNSRYMWYYKDLEDSKYIISTYNFENYIKVDYYDRDETDTFINLYLKHIWENSNLLEKIVSLPNNKFNNSFLYLIYFFTEDEESKVEELKNILIKNSDKINHNKNIYDYSNEIIEEIIDYFITKNNNLFDVLLLVSWLWYIDNNIIYKFEFDDDKKNIFYKFIRHNWLIVESDKSELYIINFDVSTRLIYYFLNKLQEPDSSIYYNKLRNLLLLWIYWNSTYHLNLNLIFEYYDVLRNYLFKNIDKDKLWYFLKNFVNYLFLNERDYWIIDLFPDCIEVLSSLLKENAENVELLYDKYKLLEKVWSSYYYTKSFQKSLECLLDSYNWYKRLLKDYPKNSYINVELVKILWKIWDCYLSLPNEENATEYYNNAIKYLTKNIKIINCKNFVNFSLSENLYKIWKIYFEKWDDLTAIDNFEKAEKYISELIHNFPDNKEYLRLYWYILYYHWTSLSYSWNKQKSIITFDKCKEILKKLLILDANNGEHKYLLEQISAI